MKRRKSRDERFAPTKEIAAKWRRKDGKRRIARLERREAKREARDARDARDC